MVVGEDARVVGKCESVGNVGFYEIGGQWRTQSLMKLEVCDEPRVL